ncbi:hypothetical protein D3P07_12425 [Paenibacillus sp. 1011MAR3C5]|nr:hypothetical protein D3P07_12425 [Paenibacillus sp. 1011MAR3C5]
MEKKIKAYKFSMLASGILTIVLLVNFLSFKRNLDGVLFIIGVFTLIFTFVCYKIDTKNREK